MTPHAHNWHKRPADCGKEDPCAVCSCPAAGTRKGGTWHRATLDTEGFAYRFILRRPGRSGWEHKGIVARTSARNPARANRDLETFARQLFGFVDDTAAQPAARGEIPTPPEAETDNPPQPAARGEIPTPPEAETDDTAQPAANVSESSNPGQTTLDLMARAAVLFKLGKKFSTIETAMKLKRRTVATWKNHWPEHWEMACHTAEAQLVKMVKAQIGTPAILADVDGHLERAKRPSGLEPSFPNRPNPRFARSLKPTSCQLASMTTSPAPLKATATR